MNRTIFSTIGAVLAGVIGASPSVEAETGMRGPNAAERLVLSYYDGHGVNDLDYKAPHANRPTPKRPKRRPSATPKLFKGHRV